MEKKECTVESIIYQDPNSGYSVFQASVKGNDEEVKLVGVFHGIVVGAVLNVEGDWQDNQKYGKQFKVDSWSEKMPVTKEGIEKYLGSGLIKGIGETTAKRIVSKFGQETFNVMDNDIDKLLEVSGIGNSLLGKIRDSWEQQKGVKDIMFSLQSYGVSSTYAAKIYKQYGKGCVEKVKSNPYCLADDIDGIGFKTADEIAQRLGYGKNDQRRCRSGIIYTLNDLARQGHVYSEGMQLINAAKELLQADKDPLLTILKQMIEAGDLMLDNDVIFLPHFYHAECGVANKLRKLMHNTGGNLLDGSLDIEEITKKTGIHYDDIQAAAIKQAVKSKVMVLTGGPGTGKTTTTLGIIAALESLGQSILLTAPTGRAAKRMSETTGKEAKTIHRLLEFNPAEGYGRNDGNPLEGDVLIVDESSMIDIMLMDSLLKAVPLHMRLILVGDIDQLPSIGAGNVLKDIIDSGVIPVVRLTKIFRQAQSSRIITNAHKINQGIFPDISNSENSDFIFIKQEDPNLAAQEIINVVKNRIPKEYHYSTNDIQVLAPMKNSAVGTKELNNALQEAINPIGDNLFRGGFNYRKGDRVMQIRNNYDRGVFNGDIGIVEGVNVEDKSLTILYDGKTVEYEDSELDELTLAYATTIHKSQGSEYPVVVIPLLMTHSIMLQRNLIYTGITRAKKICVIIGTEKALTYSICNTAVQKRNTKLKERLFS